MTFDEWWNDPPEDGPTPDGTVSKATAQWIWNCAQDEKREQLRALVEAVRDANAAASGDRWHLCTERQRLAWCALMDGLEVPNAQAQPRTQAEGRSESAAAQG